MVLDFRTPQLSNPDFAIVKERYLFVTLEFIEHELDRSQWPMSLCA
jgi:hypothetical protein